MSVDFKQPKDKVIFKNKYFVAEIVFNPKLAQEVDAYYGIGSPVQKFWDEMLLNAMNDYVYFNTGNLRQRAIEATTIGDGELIWPGPESFFLWSGYVMVDPETKSPFARAGVTKELTDRLLVSHAGGITGAKWTVRAENDLYSDWVNQAQEYIRRL